MLLVGGCGVRCTIRTKDSSDRRKCNGPWAISFFLAKQNAMTSFPGVRILFGLLTCVLIGNQPVFAQKPAANRKLMKMLEEDVIPAYNAGDSSALLDVLVAIVTRVESTRLKMLDELLEKRQLPSLAEMLVESRIALAQQDEMLKSRKPHWREIVVALPAVVKRVQEIQQVAQAHPAMSGQRLEPKNFMSYQELFWELHVLEQRLANAVRLLGYAADLKKFGEGVNRNQLSDREKRILDWDDSMVTEELHAVMTDLHERSLELRLQRFDFAFDTIQDASEFKNRFLAVYFIDQDGELLGKAFNDNLPPKFKREILNESGLARSIRAKVVKVRHEAGRLVEQARALHQGLHWWMRGRYGRGPDGGGLLKSTEAIRTPAGLFGLLMPVETPKVTDPEMTSMSSIPEFRRRHHYHWMFETRRIQTVGLGRKVEKTRVVNAEQTEIKYFY